MKCHVWVFGEPLLNLGAVVSGEVVEHYMNLTSLVSHDGLVHELDKFHGSASRKAPARDFASANVERAKQVSGSVPDILMSALLSPATVQGQHLLDPVQCLDPALLIHRQYDRTLGRIEVETNDI